MSLRKRQRSASSSRLAAFCSPPPPSPPPPSSTSSSPDPLTFPNADVFLRLHLDPSSPDDVDANPDADSHHSTASSGTFLDLHVSSASLLRSCYFAALLSDRWPAAASGRLSLVVVASPSCPRPFDAHIEVLHLLHTLDFVGSIRSPGDALDLLPVALLLLFDACVEACIRFLKAVPWSKEEEARVIDLAGERGRLASTAAPRRWRIRDGRSRGARRARTAASALSLFSSVVATWARRERWRTPATPPSLADASASWM